jgi:D-aspartate ligase
MSGSPRSDGPISAVVLAADVNGLGVVRGLHLAGIPSVLVTDRPADPGLWSRVPRKVVAVPPGERRDEVLLEALRSLSDGRPVLIPTTDVYVGFMTAHRDELDARFRIVLPDDTVIASLLDKQAETELMERMGVPLARTERRLHLRVDSWWHGLRFPVIVKPRMSAFVHYLGTKNRILRTPEEAATFSADHAPILQYLLAQEVIEGDDAQQWVCNSVFNRRHELISAFVFQRLRLSPAHFGVTSLAVSRRNPDVLALVERIGLGLRHVGPAMVEFKFDQRDATYKYIETNPRIGLANYFDTTCGVNNVAASYRLACGDDSSRNGPQREGLYFLSWFDDLFARRKDGEPLAAILRSHVSVLLRPHVGAYWCWYDPMPGLVMAWRNVSAVCRSTLRHLTGTEAANS